MCAANKDIQYGRKLNKQKIKEEVMRAGLRQTEETLTC